MANSNEYMREYMAKRYHKRRLELIALLGGKCSQCKSLDRLEIDHKVYQEKKFDIAKMLSGWSWDKIRKEAEKCQILCYRCHRIKTGKDLSDRFNQREEWEHGTIGGYRYCSCSLCRTAKRDYMREYRKNKK